MSESILANPRDVVGVPGFLSSRAERMLKYWSYSEQNRVECFLSLVEDVRSSPHQVLPSRLSNPRDHRYRGRSASTFTNSFAASQR